MPDIPNYIPGYASNNPYSPYNSGYGYYPQYGATPNYNTGANFYQQQMNRIAAPQMPIMPNGGQLVTRLVTSIEEVKAASIDALNYYMFVDVGNKKIYTKQITPMGTAEIVAYRVEEPTQEEDKIVTTINSIINNVNSLDSRLKQIENEWNGGIKDEPITTTTNTGNADNQSAGGLFGKSAKK